MWSPADTVRCPKTFPTSWPTGLPSTQLNVVPTTTRPWVLLKPATIRAYDGPDEHDTVGSVQPAVRLCNDRPVTTYPATCSLLPATRVAAPVADAADPQPYTVKASTAATAHRPKVAISVSRRCRQPAFGRAYAWGTRSRSRRHHARQGGS